MAELQGSRWVFVLLIFFVLAVPVIVLTPEQYTLEIFIGVVVIAFIISIFDYIHFKRMNKFAEEARKNGIDV